MQNELFLGGANFSFGFSFQGSFRDAQEFVVLCVALLLRYFYSSFPANKCLAVMQSDSDHGKE